MICIIYSLDIVKTPSQPQHINYQPLTNNYYHPRQAPKLYSIAKKANKLLKPQPNINNLLPIGSIIHVNY